MKWMLWTLPALLALAEGSLAFPAAAAPASATDPAKGNGLDLPPTLSIAQRILNRLSAEGHVLASASGIPSNMESLLAQQPSAVIVDPQEAEFSVTSSLRQLHLEHGVPLVFPQISLEQKSAVFEALGVPIRHVKQGASELLLLDTFHDRHGGMHYRLVNVPAGKRRRETHSAPQGQLVFGASSQEEEQASLVRGEVHWASSDSPMVNQTTGARHIVTDAAAMATVTASSALNDIVRDLSFYLQKCGGIRLASDTKRVDECWKFINADLPHSKDAGDMIPEEGAVWRELIETTYRIWTVQWGNEFPFKEEQEISHRLNTYWYLYIQAPPYSQLYYAFLLVDGIHNSHMQTAEGPAVGYYLSNLDLSLRASPVEPKADPGHIFWIKSSPATLNTRHSQGKHISTVDTFSLNMNLGFKGEEVSGSLSFSYTHTKTVSYTESREITDWSVVENTNPVTSLGKWKYYQQWPVDMLENNVHNFKDTWELFYERSWDVCKVFPAPSLSRFALTTHDSMVWALNPALRSADAKRLPVRFQLNMNTVATAVTCEIYNRHHMMSQQHMDFDDMEWEVNVADLNNIQYSS